MASIRRTLSPVPRPGTVMNGEACSVASPLSKSSSCNQKYQPPSVALPSAFGSLDYALYKAQTLVFGFFSQRSSRPLERSKLKGQIWKRALLQFFLCFVVGVFIGLTPFAPIDFSTNLTSEHQAFSFEVLHPVENIQLSNVHSNETSVAVGQLTVGYNSTPELNITSKVIYGTPDDGFFNKSTDQYPDMVFQKLLIIVTPTYGQSSQAYYLNRLAQTLKLVPSPLLWVVVEMTSQSMETANILRRTGVMYRHLVCNKNWTEVKDRGVHLRNAALSHIETHHLDGIVYFADDDKIYTADLFQHMRQIRRFGTWTVAKLGDSPNKITFEGPICNGSQVIGWHTDDRTKRFRRFHAEISGFAFNSTILWDPRRWHRPTLEPIRQLDTVREGFQASSFIEQVVEDESQMEVFPLDCSRVMVWQFDPEKLYPYPYEWFPRNYSGNINPLA